MQWYRPVSSCRRVYRVHLVRICATVRPHDASQRRLSSLTRSAQDFTFQPVEHLHQHRRNTTATVFAAALLKGIRQAGAAFGQLTGGGFT
ncbi:hypothetical protein ACNKHU_24805 [Shigella flexneri]